MENYTPLSSILSVRNNSVTDSVDLHSFSRCCLLNMPTRLAQNSHKIWTYSSSRSSKVDDFGTNRRRICDFLLVINSNFGRILHRFWDMATYWLKIAYFSHPSLIRRIRSLSSLWNFKVKLSVRKLESWGYYSATLLPATVFDWSTPSRVTDRRTGDSI